MTKPTIGLCISGSTIQIALPEEAIRSGMDARWLLMELLWVAGGLPMRAMACKKGARNGKEKG